MMLHIRPPDGQRAQPRPLPPPVRTLQTPLSITSSTNSIADSIPTCQHSDLIIISHIGLVGHLRTHRDETDELVPVSPATAPTAYEHSVSAWAYRVICASMKIRGKIAVQTSSPHLA
ncbi:hypothetical protein SprV_0100295700 [Sparganum proliferum]